MGCSCQMHHPRATAQTHSHRHGRDQKHATMPAASSSSSSSESVLAVASGGGHGQPTMMHHQALMAGLLRKWPSISAYTPPQLVCRGFMATDDHLWLERGCKAQDWRSSAASSTETHATAQHAGRGGLTGSARRCRQHHRAHCSGRAGHRRTPRQQFFFRPPRPAAAHTDRRQ